MIQFSQADIIQILRQKTGYYKKDLRVVLNALNDAIITVLATAKIDEPVQIKLFDGFYIQAKFEPERPARDPRTGEWITAREKIKPNVQVRRWFKECIEKEAGILPDKNKENNIEGEF